MNFVLTVVMSLLVASCALAQKRDSVWSSVPFSAIKASPLHLINFYPTIQISYEQRIFSRVTLQAEGGYVLDYGDDDESFEDRRGSKLRIEGRYYLGPTHDRDRIHYISLESYLNKVDFNRYAVVEECFDAECNRPYVRRFPYKVEYRENGVSLKTGVLWYMGLRFFVDGSAGFTVRNVDYDKPPLPPGAGHNDDGFFTVNIPNETDRLTLGPNLGLRVGYRLK